MLDGLLGFEWDVHNAGHIALHNVSPEEVEEVAQRRHMVIPATAQRGEKRWKLFGRTDAGRYLVVVFTIRHRRLRVVTAYTMSKSERRIYGGEIEG